MFIFQFLNLFSVLSEDMPGAPMPGQTQPIQYSYGGGNMAAGPPVGPQSNMYGWSASGAPQNQGMMPQGKTYCLCISC